MPPKGGTNWPDATIRMAVDYMVSLNKYRAIERAQAHRFRDVDAADLRFARQVRAGARELEHAVIGARR